MRSIPSLRSCPARRAAALVAGALALAASSAPAAAQKRSRVVTISATAAAADVFARAQRLVAEGQGAAGRAVVDSVLSSASEGSELFAEALFWRATLAATAADAERDYRTLAVEYSMSPRAADALMRLAQLELARGDRAQALRHLEKLVAEHPTSPARARASYWMARAYFDAGDAARACASLDTARANARPDDAGLRTQIEAYAPRCATAARDSARDTTRVAAAAPAAVPAAVPPVAPPTPAPSTVAAQAGRSAAAPPPAKAPTVKPTPAPATSSSASSSTSPFAGAATPDATAGARGAGGAPPSGNMRPNAGVAGTEPSHPEPRAPRPVAYAVQVAAYPTRPPAESLVKTLRERGLDARVSGTAAPFRVRIGRYATSAEAERAAAAMKERGQAAWVVSEAVP